MLVKITELFSRFSTAAVVFLWTSATALFLLSGASTLTPGEHHSLENDWEIPDQFKHMENPVEMDNQSARMGRSLYRRNCSDCHGSTGAGDGPEAPDLETEMRDFASEEVQTLTDGELFYKTLEGRDEMPGFKADLVDEDIWYIVNFMRTLAED